MISGAAATKHCGEAEDALFSVTNSALGSDRLRGSLQTEQAGELQPRDNLELARQSAGARESTVASGASQEAIDETKIDRFLESRKTPEHVPRVGKPGYGGRRPGSAVALKRQG